MELWAEHEGFEDARPGSQVIVTLENEGDEDLDALSG